MYTLTHATRANTRTHTHIGPFILVLETLFTKVNVFGLVWFSFILVVFVDPYKSTNHTFE